MHRRVPGRLHLRRGPDALHPPRRVRGLRRLRTGLPGGSHLLRGRRPRPVEGIHQGQRRLLRRARLAGRRGLGRQDGQRPAVDQGPGAGRARRVIAELPDFPWDTLAAAGARARAHPDGIVDLSVGTPVDPVPAVIQEALTGAAWIPGYPTTHGTPALREAAAEAQLRRYGVRVDPAAVLP